MKNLCCFGLLVVLVLSVAGCAGALAPAPAKPPEKAAPAAPAGIAREGDWRVEWDKKVAAAREEKELLFYWMGVADARMELTRAFGSKFGIKLEFVTGLPMELAQKMVNERTAGLYLADAINMGGATLLTVVKPQGLLRPLEPDLILPEVKEPGSWKIGRLPLIDKDGQVVGMLANYERYVARNTELVREEEISSLKDLLNPRWKGKLVMQDPTMTGAGLSMSAFLGRTWGLEQALDFLRGLVNQEVVTTRDKRAQVEWVSRGKYAIAIAPAPDVLSEFKALGSPIASVRLAEGGGLQTVGGALAMPARPAHPNASVVFLNWLLSKDGQDAYVKGIRLPSARLDVSHEGIDELFFAGPGDKLTYGDEEFFLLQGKMLPSIRDIFAGPAK